MSFRLPLHPSHGRSPETPTDALDVEILAEKAASLGRAGRKVEQALAEFKSCADGPERSLRLSAAADAVHALFIQRELLGFFRQADAVERYGIPSAVLARVGVC